MIAACQHDIGMWTDLAVDYLPPSRREAVPHLDLNELSPWLEETRECDHFVDFAYKRSQRGRV